VELPLQPVAAISAEVLMGIISGKTGVDTDQETVGDCPCVYGDGNATSLRLDCTPFLTSSVLEALCEWI